ncbi:MAG: V-type ATP synthase subunit I [Spirochaetales bacterium]|jgi:V/A-type H+-transporting ATPase subunit I|nr:V-type ATP synthase subunit I [Spirochaetales bacterium]
MIFPAKMKKLELLIFKTDTDAVLEYLGTERCFQVSDRIEGSPSQRYTELEELLRKLQAASIFLGIAASIEDGNRERCSGIPHEEDIAAAQDICLNTGPLVEREKNLVERRQKTRNTMDEIEAFGKLDLPLRDIESVTFLAFRFGIIDPARLEALRAAIGERAFIAELDESGKIFAVSSKKGRFALDTELKKVNFVETPVPEEIKNLPPEALAALEKDYADAAQELESLKEEKLRLAARYGKVLADIVDKTAAGLLTEDLKAHLVSTETTCRLSGWIPAEYAKKVRTRLEELTRGRIAIRSYAPEEVQAVKEGKEKIPVRLAHGKFLQSFSRLVVSYGTPLYGTIDPTVMVCVFFVLLFAIMFGDIGQGFVGVLAGFVLGTGKIAALRAWKKFAPIFKTVGCACMVTGFLYGSVFCSEELLVRPTRYITAHLFGYEMDRFITLLPNHGIDKIFAFFAFTIGIGVIINSIGLGINIYNRLRLKDFRHAIFAKTGIVGAFLFWYVIALALRLGLGAAFGTVDILCIALPLGLLFWGEPLYRLLFHVRPLFHEGIFTFVMEGFVEILETLSYFFSNTVSFLRVGAFAMSHAILSLIIFILADLIEQIPGGPVLRVLVVVGGNILIIVLEGLIVSIQVIRLHYYEFFSKFFTETGAAFKPFELRVQKGNLN